MATMTRRAELQPMGEALARAMERAGVKAQDVANVVKVSDASVYNWRTGKSRMMPPLARKLGNFLGIDPATLIPPDVSPQISKTRKAPARRKSKAKGRPVGRPRKQPPKAAAATGPGPAQRAVALHAARNGGGGQVEPVQILLPTQEAPRRRHEPHPADGPGVFGMEARHDGTMLVWLRANLPLERGAALLRTLLDFGLIHDNHQPEPTQPARTAQQP